MTPKDTVRTLLDALQAADFKTARSLLSSDFHFSGFVRDPLGAGPWIGLSANLKSAFPDLDYHFGIQQAEGSVVHISARLTGTHSGTLNLTALNMGMLPATGTHFSMTHEQGELTVRDQQVAAWNMLPREGAGLMTILAQLTRHVPSSRPPAAFSASPWDEARNDFLAHAQPGQDVYYD
jgi:hypothetical protein